MPAPLDYARPRRIRWTWRVWLIVSVVISAFLVLPWLTICRTETRVDAVTGSVQRQTFWLFGITTGPAIEVSPLEKRLATAGIPWHPNWRFLSRTHRNIVGCVTCRECGLAPPIYSIHPALQNLVDAASDAEVRAFVQVLQSGSDARQRAAVEEAGNRALNAPPPP